VKRNLVKIGVGSLLAFSIFSTTAFTQSYSRNISAWFNNIKVQIDGTEVILDTEPFVFNDNLYLPASLLTRGLNLDYIYTPEKNTVNIQTFGMLDSNPETSLTPIVQQKNYEIQNLTRQLESIEKELHTLKNGRFPYRNISTVGQMETYLRDHFKDLNGVSMSIQLTYLGSNKYRIVATSGNSYPNLSELDRRDIEGWIEDMFYSIRELYDAKANVEGYIRRNNYSSNHASYYTNGNKLYFSFALSQDKKSTQIDGVKLEERLNKGSLKRYNNVSFTYEVFVNRYDIDLMIYFDQNQFNSWNHTTKMNYLKALKREIENFNPYINVSGNLIYKGSASNTTNFKFGFVDGEIRSLDLLNEIASYVNKNNSTLYYSNKIFKFKYSIQETGDNVLTINVEGDFSKQDTNWTSVKDNIEYTLRKHIEVTFHIVSGVWDKDISGEIVDKNNEFIGNLRYYRPSEYSIRILENINIQ